MRISRSHVVVAAAALALGATGSATAAKLVTGKDIRDGTITARDLSKSLRKQLGVRGPAGPAGAPGTSGTPGAAGQPGAQGPPGTAADVMATVLAGDGAGSTLDADLIDGQDSTSFLAKSGGTMTGKLAVPQGTAAAPSIGFANDLNTGLYSLAAGEVRLTAGGVVRVIVNNGGLELPAGYLTMPTTSIDPAAASCDELEEYGRMIVVTNGVNAAQIWVCDSDTSATAGNQPAWIVK